MKVRYTDTKEGKSPEAKHKQGETVKLEELARNEHKMGLSIYN